MKSFSALLLAIILNVSVPVFAQHPSLHGQMTPRANEGHIPPPPRRGDSSYGATVQHLGNGRLNNTPHVDHDQWYGHDRPDDPRFDLDHPFDHGHVENIGPQYRYSILRTDRDRHRLRFSGGSNLEVAALDWPVFVDWCWDCGDDFVLYEDPDHLGWYLLYDIHTGLYVHVIYLGV